MHACPSFALRLSLLALSLGAVVGCADKSEDSAAECDAAGATSGQTTGTLNGASWAVASSWTWSGDSLQMTTTAAEGWRMTLVAHRDVNGDTLSAAAAAASADITVDLSADDGWALFYPDVGGTSLSSKEGGGTAVFTQSGAVDGSGSWRGCIDVSAASADGGETVELVGGLVDAPPM